MKLIHYGRDTIQLNENSYSFDHFKKLEPSYGVPWGFHTRVYERGVRHYITDGSNTVHLPIDDSYCNRICDREGELARLVLSLEKRNPTSPK